jgi:hypothetical protein
MAVLKIVAATSLCGLILYKHRVSFAKTVVTVVFDPTAYKLQVQLVRMWLWCTGYVLDRQPCDLEIRQLTPFLSYPPSPSQLLSSGHRPQSSTCSRVASPQQPSMHVIGRKTDGR